jgi:hypothetical protein
MSQLMPEVLDYRDILTKLARIDSEWEGLKGLLARRPPNKNELPAKSCGVHDKSRLDRGNKVVGFPPPAPATPRAESVGGRRPMAVTPREMEAIYERNRKNSYDERSMARLNQVEKQIRNLMVLVVTCMTFTLVTGAFLIFLQFKDNFSARSAAVQPHKIAAPAKVASLEPQVSTQPQPTSSAGPLATSLPSADAATGPAREVQKVSEQLSPLPAAQPAPTLVGSITSNKIHYSDCKWAAKIRPERLITFPSIAAARQQGYIPCPVCRPHEP